VLLAGASYGFSKLQTKKYTATASLLFRNPGLAQQASGVPVIAQNDPQGQRDTNVRLVKLGGAAARTAAALRLRMSPAQVESAVTVSPQGRSDVVSVSADSTSSARAAQIANAFTRAFVDQQRANDQRTIQAGIDLVEQQYAQQTAAQRRSPSGQALLDRVESLRVLKAMQTGNTEMIQRAAVPTSSSSPKTTRNTVLGGVLGLLVGVGLVFGFDRLDRRLREPDDVEAAFEAPALGVIPHGHWEPSLNGHGGPRTTAELEPFVMLRANLRYFGVSRRVRTVLVTSAASGEGKTTTAWSLATAAASMGTKALLIEADLRRPSLSGIGFRSDRGLARTLVFGEPAEDAVQTVEVEEAPHAPSNGRALDVIVAGASPPNPAELLESEAMKEVLAWATEHYELVVVDTPPLSVVADAVPLIKQVDGVIVVSRLGQGTRDGLLRLRERLGHLHAPVLGVVVNDVKRRSAPGYDYAYGYRGEMSTAGAAGGD
jgi:capsular exopolysaccharide synthesis family protein